MRKVGMYIYIYLIIYDISIYIYMICIYIYILYVIYRYIYIYDMYLYIYVIHIYIYFATLCLFAIAVPTHARRWHFHQHVWWSLVAGYPVMAAAYAQNCINTHMNFPQWLCWSWILLLANVFSPSRNMLCVKKDLRFFHKQKKNSPITHLENW